MSSLYESIRRYENSGLTALYFENRSIGYDTLLKNIRRAAYYLEEKGVRAGDVVTVALPNIPASVYFFYALDAIGAVQNILHPQLSFDAVRDAMARCNSRTAILLETVYSENSEAVDSCSERFFFVCPTYDSGIIMRAAFYLKYKRVADDGVRLFSAERFRRCPEKRDIEALDPHADSVYLHSGGTTGEPKVIALSDSAICALAGKVDGITGNIEGKSMLAVLPTFHGFGLGMGIHSPLSNGASAALMMKFNADKVIKWINEGKVNMMIGVPLLYRKLMAARGFSGCRLDRITHCFVGGDNVQPSLIEAFDRALAEGGSEGKLLEGYGLTETVTVCAVNTRESCKPGSVGLPLRGIEITVRDESGIPLPAGETGEVYVSSDTVMNGYLGDPEASAHTLPEAEGKVWVRTGDLGYLDSDGYLWLKGRKKRLFKISGVNVYPSEAEKLACSVDGVRDASLEYIEGERPRLVLFVIRDRDSGVGEDELSERINGLLRRSLIRYSLPAEIKYLDRFPETRVGKIDHASLSKEC